MIIMKYIISFFILSSVLIFGNDVKDRAVIIEAKFKNDAIHLSWLPDSNAYRYIVLRKYTDEPRFIDTLAVLEGDVNSFVDDDVVSGIPYEYAVWKDSEFEYVINGETKIFEYDGYGYIYAGKDLPLIEDRGHILLLVDNTLKESISDGLEKYKLSLVGDGWTVSEYEVPRAEKFNPKAVKTVKDIIKFEYERMETKLRSVVIIGRIPVPYSGEEAIDGHRPDHLGAWPTDIYYADIDGLWTDDTTTNITVALDPRHYNIPYDGKFDQNRIPSETEVELGRIDMFDLTFFHNEPINLSEVDLLNRYFEKNHNYKNRIMEFEDNALIDDHWKLYSEEAWSSNPWNGFSSLVGYNAIDTGGMRRRLEQEKFKIIWGGNSGAYDNILHTAYANEYAQSDQNAVFAFYFGSWMPDWDAENALMRSAIASNPSILVSAFYGRPPWYIHHLNIGETIGYSSKITQNNGVMYKSTSYVGRKHNHIALIGDPAVRFHPEIPPKDLTYSDIGGTVELLWECDGDALGFNIYQSYDIFGLYKKINDELVENKSFVIHNHQGKKYFQVRAIYNRITVSTNYLNQSQGVFIEVNNPTSAFENNKSTSIEVYPNPTERYIRIEGSTNLFGAKVRLVDLLGNSVWDGNMTDRSMTIDLSTINNLQTGTFYIIIVDENKYYIRPILFIH